MKDARPAGEPKQLEVRIGHKAFAAASGGRLEVLHDIAFALERGEVAAFVGPSGCGKTTMLRIIAGLDEDFEGEVQRRNSGALGMVFQEPRLLPWRTVEQNVRLVAPELTDETLASLLSELELDAHRKHFPGELSLGLARRVSLARALAVKPDLLLLDEPFVSLDQALAARLRNQLSGLMRTRALTTLLVSHDLEEVARLADRVFLLSPRPARIIVAIPLTTPRDARSDREIVTMTAEVAKQIAEFAPPLIP
ncbi:MAG TPA: ATP-binding cassette domain-containing protein [Pseudolabrys sp.]|nr:ATP-binding cassette domain-containing protein [Pseudolabrys sp.]